MASLPDGRLHSVVSVDVVLHLGLQVVPLGIVQPKCSAALGVGDVSGLNPRDEKASNLDDLLVVPVAVGLPDASDELLYSLMFKNNSHNSFKLE